MITFFTTAKPFVGHTGIIQRNALQSWKLLGPEIEIILFGDEEGAVEVARDLKLRHEPHVERHESGLKYIRYIFDRAQELARHDVLCYVNSDIILTKDVLDATCLLRSMSKFLMVGRRWDVDITQPVDFGNPKWQEQTRGLARQANSQRDHWWIDYFMFSRGLFYKNIPAMVIGRVGWDNWLIWKAANSGATVVDATTSVMAIHQNHNYSYHPKGQQGVWKDALAEANKTLAGSWLHLLTISDANKRLTSRGIRRNPAQYRVAGIRAIRRSYYFAQRVLVYEIWLRIWHLSLNLTRPFRTRLGLRSRSQKPLSRMLP